MKGENKRWKYKSKTNNVCSVAVCHVAIDCTWLTLPVARTNPAMPTAPHHYLPIYTTATLAMTNIMTRTEGIGPPTHPGVTLAGCSSFKGPQEWADAAVKPGITQRSSRAPCISCFNRRLVMYQRKWEEDGQMERHEREIEGQSIIFG